MRPSWSWMISTFLKVRILSSIRLGSFVATSWTVDYSKIIKNRTLNNFQNISMKRWKDPWVKSRSDFLLQKRILNILILAMIECRIRYPINGLVGISQKSLMVLQPMKDTNNRLIEGITRFYPNWWKCFPWNRTRVIRSISLG